MKNTKLTVTLHIGDQQFDTLPDDYLQRMSERLSERMSLYYTAKPDEYSKIKDTKRKQK